MAKKLKCERCNGSGRIPDYGFGCGGGICGDCKGAGVLPTATQAVEKSPRNSFTVTIPSNQTLEQAIAAGRYDWVGNDVVLYAHNEAKPHPQNYEVEILRFGHNFSTAEATARIRCCGLEPASLWHLLAVGEKYSDITEIFPDFLFGTYILPVLALGSSWTDMSGGFYFLSLNFVCSGKLGLDLYWDTPKHNWPDFYRVLAVRR